MLLAPFLLLIAPGAAPAVLLVEASCQLEPAARDQISVEVETQTAEEPESGGCVGLLNVLVTPVPAPLQSEGLVARERHTSELIPFPSTPRTSRGPPHVAAPQAGDVVHELPRCPPARS